MGRKNIFKYSPGYQLFLICGAPYYRMFYKRFSVHGRQNIPKDRPVLFAISHQNALMDPAAVIYAQPRQLVFFARADIFKKKFIARLLHFLKILPVYRPRDGFRSVENNQEVFEEAINILKHRRPVGILPEGNHVGEKRLRPLRKGAARVAFLAEEASGFELGLQIVPVGVDYSDYFHAGAELLVVFGEPINVGNYDEAYRENQPRAITLLTEEIAKGLGKVMIDIRPQEYYPAIQLASEIYFPSILKKKGMRSSLYNEYAAKKEITEKFNRKAASGDREMDELRELAGEYRAKLDRNGIRDHVVKRGRENPLNFMLKAFFMMLLLPLHLYGTILNYLPYKVPSRVTKKIRDPHLEVSVRFGAGMILFFFWYLLLGITVCFIPAPYSCKAFFLASLPVSGMFSFYYYRNFLKMRGRWRWMRMEKRSKREYDRISFLREKIQEITDGTDRAFS